MEDQQSVESVESLLLLDFTQAQIEQLTHFRSCYVEKERQQMLEELHRLEFARWLVLHGRLTDELPIKQHKSPYTRFFYAGDRGSERYRKEQHE